MTCSHSFGHIDLQKSLETLHGKSSEGILLSLLLSIGNGEKSHYLCCPMMVLVLWPFLHQRDIIENQGTRVTVIKTKSNYTASTVSFWRMGFVVMFIMWSVPLIVERQQTFMAWWTLVWNDSYCGPESHLTVTYDYCYNDPYPFFHQHIVMAARRPSSFIYSQHESRVWFFVASPEDCEGQIWPLWRCIIPDSEILGTAVSVQRGAKNVLQGRTGWVWILLARTRSTLRGSTCGCSHGMKIELWRAR